MSDNSYSLTTKKTWHQTMQELDGEMQRWGITQWETNYPKGARSEAWSQREEDRRVKLTYTKNGKPVTLAMGKQNRAVDNLRVLYLAVEDMGFNERRGTSVVLECAYVQLDAPIKA